MKKFTLILLLFYIGKIKAQTTTPDSAKYFEGSLKTVCGKVSKVFVSKTKTTFIDFSNENSKETYFTAVVFAKDSSVFQEYTLTSLKDKNVCITGMVKMFKGKPEIILKSKDQIRFP